MFDLSPGFAAGIGTIAVVGSFQTLYLGARLYADHRELAAYERVDPDDLSLPHRMADGTQVDVIYYGPEESLADGYQPDPTYGGPARDRHIERVAADVAAEQYTVVLADVETAAAYLDADSDTDRYLLWLEGDYRDAVDGSHAFQVGFLGASPELASYYREIAEPSAPTQWHPTPRSESNPRREAYPDRPMR